jgi:hypothetical protein
VGCWRALLAARFATARRHLPYSMLDGAPLLDTRLFFL